MDQVEKRVLEAIDYESMLGFIKDLIATPSYGGEETEAQQLVASEMKDLWLDVDQWWIDFEELRRHPDFSMVYQRERGLGVVGSHRGTAENPTLVLCGHIDTVAPGDPSMWRTPPLEPTVRGGNLYGRGAADMKAGLGGALYALKAVMDTVETGGGVAFMSVIGEEDGGCGALASCLRGYRGEGGVVMEPSEAKIAPQVAGAISFKIHVQGKAVHACVKEEGVSAIEKFILLHQALMGLEERRNARLRTPLYSRYQVPYAVSVGRVEGGVWPGTVPESLVFEGRIGVAGGEDLDGVKGELEACLEEASNRDPWLRNHKPRVEWAGYCFAPSSIPLDHPLLEVLRDSYREAVGREPVLEGMTYASDARHLERVAGTPTLVFGPGDVRVAHGPNEHVSLKQLEETVRTLSLAILRFTGGSG